MQPLAAIEQLGIPASHAKIYLAALQMGEANASELAKKVGMPRTTVKDLVETMHKQGLIDYYIRRGKRYWTARSPRKVLDFLKEKVSMAEALLPQLEKLERKDAARPTVQLFLGLEEVRHIFADILQTKHHIKALFPWEEFTDTVGQQFIDDFNEWRRKHFLKVQVIVPKTPATIAAKTKDAEQQGHMRFLPAEVPLKGIFNCVYGDRVAIITLGRRQPSGMIIKDASAAYMQALYFNSLWSHCTG